MIRRLAQWRGRHMRSAVALAALLAVSGDALVAAEDGVITSHGFAVFGELKYGPDFEHFDYVNPDAPKGGTFRYAQTTTFDSLNIASLITVPPSLLTFMSDTLLKLSGDEPASYYCYVCRTVSWPEDLAWMEFELRPEARFGDGQPMTPADLIFTVELSHGITTPLFSRVAQIVERVEQTGPRSVRFHFMERNLRTNVAVLGSMPVMPKHFYEGLDLARPLLEPPVANGPYRVTDFDQGRYLVMTRIEDYWARDLPNVRGRFNFDVVRHDFYRDASLLNEAFSAGLIDLRLETNTANLRQQMRLPAFRSGEIKREVIPYKNSTVYNSMTMNARRPFLSNRQVRRALVLAYDYEFLQRVILGGDFGRLVTNFPNTEFQATGLPSPGELEILEPYRDELPEEIFTTPPTVPVGGNWSNVRANLLEARELLLGEGYRVEGGRLIDPVSGQPVVLRLYSASPQQFNLAAPFIDSAKRLGIEVRFRSMDSAQLRLIARNRDFDLLLYPNVFAPTTTPGTGMALLYGSHSAATETSLNYTGMADPVFDEALRALVSAQDRQTVVDSMRVLDRVERWLHYSIPLNHSYPTPVGELPITFWDKFGRPEVEQSYNFPYYSAETWWFDPQRAGRLQHAAYTQ